MQEKVYAANEADTEEAHMTNVVEGTGNCHVSPLTLTMSGLLV